MRKQKDTDCRDRTTLGPKALEWLRTHVPAFKLMEEEAKRLEAERNANLVANGRMQ